MASVDPAVPEHVVAWLLEGDAAIRWQTKRDLLDAPPDEVEAERSLVSTTGWGQRLLGRQDPSGTWAGGLYSPKWTSTTYTLLLLRDCGLAPGHREPCAASSRSGMALDTSTGA